MKYSQDPRHAARILALQKLFEQNFKKNQPENKRHLDFSETSLCSINRIKKVDKELCENILTSVNKSYEKIDKVIAKLAPERPIDEVSRIDLQILRIAIAEGFVEKFTPNKVAIDEAIELAKEFGGEASSKFVNGVLGTLLANLDKYNL
ncbi:transcription antitermination factor NusB [Candidatus Dojkabacteria bacterium]|nr:transcription antitermination factor NusB [Candidatus Dojkabacteria bacterium]